VRTQPLYLLNCDTTGLLKLVVTLVHSYMLSHNLVFPSYLLPYVWKRKRDGKRKREREREKELGENTVIWGVLLLLPPQAMVEKD
jgi:hypothetical protein